MPKDMKRSNRAIDEMRRHLASKPGYLQHSELLYMMHELSRMISTHFDKAATAHHLTHAQWWALMHIFENEGVTQSELAAIMQMGRPSTGRLIERLEQKGWIERRADSADGRRRRVYLGDAAVPVFGLMNEEGQRLFRHFLANISPTEEQALIVGLRKIKANAEQRVQPLVRVRSGGAAATRRARKHPHPG